VSVCFGTDGNVIRRQLLPSSKSVLSFRRQAVAASTEGLSAVSSLWWISVRLRRRFDDSSRHLDGVALVDNDSPRAAPIVGVVSTSASRRVAWRLRRRYVGGTVHVIVDSKSTSESTLCRLHHSRRALGVGVGTVELARSVFRTWMLSWLCMTVTLCNLTL